MSVASSLGPSEVRTLHASQRCQAPLLWQLQIELLPAPCPQYFSTSGLCRRVLGKAGSS